MHRQLKYISSGKPFFIGNSKSYKNFDMRTFLKQLSQVVLYMTPKLFQIYHTSHFRSLCHMVVLNEYGTDEVDITFCGS